MNGFEMTWDDFKKLVAQLVGQLVGRLVSRLVGRIDMTWNDLRWLDVILVNLGRHVGRLDLILER